GGRGRRWSRIQQRLLLLLNFGNKVRWHLCHTAKGRVLEEERILLSDVPRPLVVEFIIARCIRELVVASEQNGFIGSDAYSVQVERVLKALRAYRQCRGIEG